MQNLVSGGAWLFSHFFIDEVHQYIIPNRGGKIADVCIDVIGAFIGIFVGGMIQKLYKTKS